MANKALSRRQKMMLQSQPLKAAATTRNPALVASGNKADAQRLSALPGRQPQNRLLKKLLGGRG